MAGLERSDGLYLPAGVFRRVALFLCEDAQYFFPTGGFTSQFVTGRAESEQICAAIPWNGSRANVFFGAYGGRTALDHGSNLPTLMPSRTSGT